MALRTQRVIAAVFSDRDWHPRGQYRQAPVKVVLEPGNGGDTRAPVRIFIGTEAAQFRAERTLLWSIRRHRDPSRSYEIYLMKDLAGFKRLRWLTGFTNYRYAIPEFAGFAGRAIYNDADQIYLDDPARLFDTDMQGRGVLSINDHDTSVMLVDCARMASCWNLETARSRSRRALEADMREESGLWGKLDGNWNVHGEDYIPGQSRLVHYTTIHGQPWRPAPRDYVYQPSPSGDLWQKLEGEADAAGFQVFDAAHPSPDFPADRELPGAAAGTPVTGLEEFPDWDIPWMLDDLFSRNPDGVSIRIDANARPRRTPTHPLWWYAQLTAAGARHPRVPWQLTVRNRGLLPGRHSAHCWSGGPPAHLPPRTWVLLYYKAGHRSQALGLAEALGWEYETRDVMPAFLRYGLAAARTALGRAPGRLPGGIAPPWPDLVIASGWIPALIARWIARRSGGRTRLILLGRKSGPVGETQNIGIACRHFRLWPEPRRLDTVLPPNKVNRERLAQAAQRWPKLFDDRPAPHVVLLAGGSSRQCEMTPNIARDMATQVRRRVEDAGGTLAVVTSRRTGAAAAEALRDGAGPAAIVETWRPQSESANPYLGYLNAADILVVTGDSESMLAEAVTTGKPVYIYPLPPRRPGPLLRLSEAIYHHARRDRLNTRGSHRPQQGLQYLCARIVHRRWLLPPRDLHTLHQGLIDLGVARRFGEALGNWTPQPWGETPLVAARIRKLLGVDTSGLRTAANDTGPGAAPAVNDRQPGWDDSGGLPVPGASGQK